METKYKKINIDLLETSYKKIQEDKTIRSLTLKLNNKIYMFTRLYDENKYDSIQTETNNFLVHVIEDNKPRLVVNSKDIVDYFKSLTLNLKYPVLKITSLLEDPGFKHLLFEKYRKNKNELIKPGFIIFVSFIPKNTNKNSKSELYKISYIDYGDIVLLFDIKQISSDYSRYNVKYINFSNIDNKTGYTDINIYDKQITNSEFDISNPKISVRQSFDDLRKVMKIPSDAEITGIYAGYVADTSPYNIDLVYYDKEDLDSLYGIPLSEHMFRFFFGDSFDGIILPFVEKEID